MKKFTEYTKEVCFTVRGSIDRECAHKIVAIIWGDDSDVASARFQPDAVFVRLMTDDEGVAKAQTMLNEIVAAVGARPFEWIEEPAPPYPPAVFVTA